MSFNSIKYTGSGMEINTNDLLIYSLSILIIVQQSHDPWDMISVFMGRYWS